MGYSEGREKKLTFITYFLQKHKYFIVSEAFFFFFVFRTMKTVVLKPKKYTVKQIRAVIIIYFLNKKYFSVNEKRI